MDNTKIQKAKEIARILFDGKEVPHRACSIALAETFCLPTKAYHGLQRGGITGDAECGAIVAGRLILSEILGDDDPTAPITKNLFEGMHIYRKLYETKLEKTEGSSLICNDLVRNFNKFDSPERHSFCTCSVAIIAECIAETLETMGASYQLKDLSDLIK